MGNQQNKELVAEKGRGIRKSTGFLISAAGTIILFIESMLDIFMKEFYGNMEMFGVQYTPEIVLIMAIVGMVFAVFIAFFLFFLLKKSSHYIILLIVSVISLLVSFAFFGPIVLIAGSIIGIRDKKNQ